MPNIIPKVVPYHKEMVDGMSIAPMLALATRWKQGQNGTWEWLLKATGTFWIEPSTKKDIQARQIIATSSGRLGIPPNGGDCKGIHIQIHSIQV